MVIPVWRVHPEVMGCGAGRSRAGKWFLEASWVQGKFCGREPGLPESPRFLEGGEAGNQLGAWGRSPSPDAGPRGWRVGDGFDKQEVIRSDWSGE